MVWLALTLTQRTKYDFKEISKRHGIELLIAAYLAMDLQLLQCRHDVELKCSRRGPVRVAAEGGRRTSGLFRHQMFREVKR